MHAFNLITWEAEAGRFQKLRPAWATSETLPQKSLSYKNLLFVFVLSDPLFIELFYCFLASWALHSAIVDVIYDGTRVAVVYTAAHRLGSPQDFFNGSRESSG